jgi:hypothetical protein
MAQPTLALCEQRPCQSGKTLFYRKKREDRGPLCGKFNNAQPPVVGIRTLSGGRAGSPSFDPGVVRLNGSKGGRVEVALVCERLDCIARAKKALRLDLKTDAVVSFTYFGTAFDS